MNLYKQIFKRKSFHKFKNIEQLNYDDLNLIDNCIKNIVPLDDSINVKIKIVKESETSCKVNAEYCILFYSEKKEYYLENIGYIGEQIDLFLSANNIGTLWCGLGKAKETSFEGLDYVIMICIAKVSELDFRTDLKSFKRKPLDKTWEGELLPISKDVILAPSAVNSQPWYIKNSEESLLIYRNTSCAKFGIIPLKIMQYYNQIDLGIYLLFIEICLTNYNFIFTRNLQKDNDNKKGLILIAKYMYRKEFSSNEVK